MELSEEVQNWLRSKSDLEDMDLMEIYNEIKKESKGSLKDKLKEALLGIVLLKEEVNRLGCDLRRKRNSLFIIEIWLDSPENTLISWYTSRLKLESNYPYLDLLEHFKKVLKAEKRAMSRVKIKLILAILKEIPEESISLIKEF